MSVRGRTHPAASPQALISFARNASPSARVRVYLLRPTLGEGGADRVTVTLLQHLDRRLFDPHLVLLRREGTLLDEVPGGVDILDLRARSPWTALPALVQLVRRRPPDVLFSTSGGTNALAVLARDLLPSRCRFRLVLSERNQLYHGGTTLRRWLLVQAKRLTYRRADSILAVSEGVKRDLVRRLGVRHEEVSVVYSPVVTPQLGALAGEPLADPWFDSGDPVVVAVGRLVPEKGFATLIEAFALVLKRRSARLLILGEGPLRGQLAGLARRLGVAEEVRLPGFVRNPFKYLSRACCFVLSSTHEGLPGALIQAMALGLPVVATNCPSGPSEIVAEGEDGLLVPVGDPSTLAARIAFLLDRPIERERLGRNARRTAVRFSVESVIGSYVDAILGESNLRPPAVAS